MLGPRRFTFELFNAEDPHKFVWKNHETLTLVASTEEEMESWMASFLRAGGPLRCRGPLGQAAGGSLTPDSLCGGSLRLPCPPQVSTRSPKPKRRRPCQRRKSLWTLSWNVR
jgi:hypothetical protein